MIKNTLIGLLFVLLEILICAIGFFLLSDALKGTNYPFTTNLLFATIVNTVFHTLIALSILILFAALNQRITKESFNYKFAVPFLILGVFVGYYVVDWIHFETFLKYEYESVNRLILVVSYAIPIMFFNLGIRIQTKKSKK